MADAFAKGIFQPPTRPGVDYMLSTENIVVVDEDKAQMRESFLTELEGIEGSAKCGMAVAFANNPHSILQLRLYGFSIPVVLIAQKNIENMHVQAMEHCGKTRIPFGDVRVGVNQGFQVWVPCFGRVLCVERRRLASTNRQA